MASRDLMRLAAWADLIGWVLAVAIVTGERAHVSLVIVSLVLRVLVDLLPLRFAWTTLLASVMRGRGAIALGFASVDHPARALPGALMVTAVILGIQGWRSSTGVAFTP